MDLHKRIVSGVILLTALLTLFLWVGSMYVYNASKPRVYTSQFAGLSFVYNPSYIIEEKNINDTVRALTLVSLKDSMSKSAASETEPQISCSISTATPKIVLSAWIKSSEYSSVAGHLVDGTVYPSIDIPGVEAIGFKTDGLYMSDHVLFKHNGQVVDCRVGYVTLDDPLRMEFSRFVSSISLSPVYQ